MLCSPWSQAILSPPHAPELTWRPTHHDEGILAQACCWQVGSHHILVYIPYAAVPEDAPPPDETASNMDCAGMMMMPQSTKSM
jgi:hypothetical protein